MQPAGILVVACLALMALAAPAPITPISATIGFSGNVSLALSAQNLSFAFREVTAVFTSIDGLFGIDLNVFVSQSDQVTETGLFSSTLDAISGSFISLTGLYPQNFAAWVESSSSLTLPSFSELKNIAQFSTITPTLLSPTFSSSLSFADAFAFIAYIGVKEIDPYTGTTVSSVDFSRIAFNQNSNGILTDPTGFIKYAWFSNTPTANSPGLYNFTAFSSSVLGQVPYGAVVTPKSLDVILEIDNYPYAYLDGYTPNQLELTFFAVYAATGVSSSVVIDPSTNSISYGSGASQAYIGAAAFATINGESVAVNVSITEATRLDLASSLGIFDSFLETASFSESLGFGKFTVTFPAGATNIIYDPIVGFEKPVLTSPSSAPGPSVSYVPPTPTIASDSTAPSTSPTSYNPPSQPYVQISFSGNASLTSSAQSHSFAFREVSASFVSFPSFSPVFNAFFSDAVQVTATSNSGSLDAVATGFVTLTTHYPQGFAAWFDVASDYTPLGSSITVIDVATTLAGSLSAGLSTAGGLAGIAYTGLTELDPDGNVVSTVNFKNIVFDQSSDGLLTDSTGNVQFAWISNTPTGESPALYNFTVLTSSVLGQLPYGATVTPKSVDSIFTINNYPYASPNNKLQLTYYAAYGVAGYTGAPVFNFTTKALAFGSGASQVYVSGAASASISGSSASVDITASVSASITADVLAKVDFFASIIQSAFSASSGSGVFNVTFPAGAENIIYDPVVGFEEPQTSASSSTSSNNPSSGTTTPATAVPNAATSLSAVFSATLVMCIVTLMVLVLL